MLDAGMYTLRDVQNCDNLKTGGYFILRRTCHLPLPETKDNFYFSALCIFISVYFKIIMLLISEAGQGCIGQ
jgi:hypothetical protein